MALLWKPWALENAPRFLCAETEDGSVHLSFCLTLQANGAELSLAEGEAISVSPQAMIFQFGTQPLQIALHMERSPDYTSLFLWAEIQNLANEPVRLGEFRLLDIDTARGEKAQLAGDTGKAVYLQISGTTGPTRVRRAAEETESFSRILLQFVSLEAQRALHLGFVPFTNQFTWLRFSYNETGFKALQAICDFQDYLLPPGESIQTDTLHIEASTDFYESLERWAERAAAYYRPRLWPKIPGGWLGWAWADAFNVERYEDVVLRNCRAIRERLPGCDIEYVWVSIGNLKDGYPGNWLEWDYTNFPSGPENLVSQLAQMGFKLGFWCGAFWICEASEHFASLKEACLQLQGQPALAQKHWNYGAAARKPQAERPAIYSLDPTHPKAAEFIRHVFETYRQWGIRYYMIDFLNAISYPLEGAPYDEHYDKSVRRGPHMLRTGLKIVREAAGPETYLLSSSGPTLWNVGLMDACRMGNDYGEGRALNPESYFYPATFVINNPDFWTSHKYASSNMAGYYFTHHKLFINDSGNVLTIDKPIPLSEAQIAVSIFGLCGGPVMLGDDFTHLSEERLNLIRKLFPRTAQIARPVDLFERPLPDYPRVFHLHVASGWDEWDIVTVLNYDEEALTLPLDLERLGLDPQASYRLFEFWNEQYMGIVTGTFTAIVPPRSVRVYRLSRYPKRPWILGTDMHLLQGYVELQNVCWEARTLTLSGRATRPAGFPGTIYVAAPAGLAVKNPQGYHIAKDGRDDSLIITRQFTFGDKAEEFVVQFEIYDEKLAREAMERE